MRTVYEPTDRGAMPTEYADKGCEFCPDCSQEVRLTEMVDAGRYDFSTRRMETIKLCVACAPKCNWTLDGEHFCQEVSMAHSEGGWCEEHEKLADAMFPDEDNQGFKSGAR